MKLFLNKLKEAEVKLFMLRKYVDDVNLVVLIVDKSWLWERGENKRLQLVWTNEKEIQDEEEGISADERTMKRIQEMANSLIEGKFTIYLSEKYKSKKVPMLDLAFGWTQWTIMSRRSDTKIMKSQLLIHLCFMEEELVLLSRK